MMKGTDLADLIADVKEQVLYLQELGVESFDVKLSDRISPNLAADFIEPALQPVSHVISNLRSEISNVPTTTEMRPSGASRLASLPSLAKRATAVPVRTPEALEAEAIHDVSA